MKLTAWLVILVMAGLMASTLWGGQTSFRCGRDLIDIGHTMYQVRQACGNPDVDQRVGERRTFQILQNDQIKLESITYLTEWTYKRDNGFYILTFEGSRLVSKEYVK